MAQPEPFSDWDVFNAMIDAHQREKQPMSRVIPTLAELAEAARDWRADGSVIVLCCGCWDPIHPGHVQHLEAARKEGNVLVVGVASDHLVRTHKQKPNGPRRPFMSDAHRAIMVSNLRCVDAAVINHAACELIEALRPHVYVKGEEYRGNLTPDLEAESELLATYGGRLEFLSGGLICSSTAMLASV